MLLPTFHQASSGRSKRLGAARSGFYSHFCHRLGQVCQIPCPGSIPAHLCEFTRDASSNGNTKAVQPLSRERVLKNRAKTSMDKLDDLVWKIFVKGIYKS